MPADNHNAYVAAEYPWDFASCGDCLIMHALHSCEQHKMFCEAAAAALFPKVMPPNRPDSWYREHMTQALYLREQFADCYPKQPAFNLNS